MKMIEREIALTAGPLTLRKPRKRLKKAISRAAGKRRR
jgi:hypothetical protein